MQKPPEGFVYFEQTGEIFENILQSDDELETQPSQKSFTLAFSFSTTKFLSVEAN